MCNWMFLDRVGAATVTRRDFLRPVERRVRTGAVNLGWAHGALLTTSPAHHDGDGRTGQGVCQRRLARIQR